MFTHNYYIVKLLETIFFFLFLACYLFTILINPGIPNREHFRDIFDKKISNENRNNFMSCNICNITFPRNFNISHCSTCGVCVIKQDHHCPWTGKCIGKNNVISFYCFLWTLLGFICMNIISLITFIINLEE